MGMEAFGAIAMVSLLAGAFVLAGIVLIARKGDTPDKTAELTGLGIFMLIIAAMAAISGILPTVCSS